VRADWITLASVGFFILLLGAIWLFTPNLAEEAVSFARDLAANRQNLAENIVLPAPVENHPALYTAAMQFCFIFGAFQVVMLAIKLFLGEKSRRAVDGAPGIAFLFVAGCFLSLLTSESVAWFGFIAGMIVSTGVAIVVASLLNLLK
jgi:hypothetical protein